MNIYISICQKILKNITETFFIAKMRLKVCIFCCGVCFGLENIIRYKPKVAIESKLLIPFQTLYNDSEDILLDT